MMNLRKLPTDMNTNQYEKLMQVPPRGAERATSDGVTIEEYRPVDQRWSMSTVAEVYTKFTDKSEPTLSQGPDVVAEEAGTDGTTNVRDRSIDQNNHENDQYANTHGLSRNTGTDPAAGVLGISRGG